jgi:hypothetical protein
MSLLKKVKAKLSQKVQATKEQRQRKQLNESILNKEKEEARWQGYRKGSIAQARKEGFQQAKTKSSRGGMFGTLSNVGVKANAGLDFLNQDFGTAFSGTRKPEGKDKKKGKKKKAKSNLFEMF